MKALILAGGFATRLWPLTIDKAKPLLPICDKTFISHIVEKIPCEIPIIVSTNAVFQHDFFAWQQTHPDRDLTVFIEDADSERGKFGALGAIRYVIEQFKIDEDLLVIAGDNYFTFSIEDFISDFRGQPMLAVYDVKDLAEAKKYGVVITDDRRIVDFQEKPEAPKSTFASTGCYLYPRQILPEIIEAAKLMPDTLGGPFVYFLEQGIEAEVFRFDEYWNDIGTFNAYVDAHVQSGAGSSVPERLREACLQNHFAGVNYIDPSCHIINSTIKNSIIMSGCRIENCTIKSSIIDKNSEFRNLELAGEIVKQGTVLLN